MLQDSKIYKLGFVYVLMQIKLLLICLGITLIGIVGVYAMQENYSKEINPPTNLQKAFIRNLIKDMPQEQAEIIINEEIFQVPDEYRIYPEARGILIKQEVKG